MSSSIMWLCLGGLGQALFSCRFLLQWLASERAKRSVVPVSFWMFSLAGGVTLLVYALYRRDPVFIFGQASGLFIYLRKLILIYRDKKITHAGQHTHAGKYPPRS